MFLPMLGSGFPMTEREELFALQDERRVLELSCLRSTEGILSAVVTFGAAFEDREFQRDQFATSTARLREMESAFGHLASDPEAAEIFGRMRGSVDEMRERF